MFTITKVGHTVLAIVKLKYLKISSKNVGKYHIKLN